jgi:hypothetical protein
MNILKAFLDSKNWVQIKEIQEREQLKSLTLKSEARLGKGGTSLWVRQWHLMLFWVAHTHCSTKGSDVACGNIDAFPNSELTLL